jgi:hypothetical protein
MVIAYSSLFIQGDDIWQGREPFFKGRFTEASRNKK